MTHPTLSLGKYWKPFRATLKFAKIKTNMAARGLLRKTLFPPSLVSCLRYQLFLLSRTSILQAISKGKHSVKPLCWNVNVKKSREKVLLGFSLFFLLGQSNLRVFMELFYGGRGLPPSFQRIFSSFFFIK